ncbi:MAG: hypothetical protein IID18_04285 [Nitrospinae bacterium]|nr:hypothetical protein [Nitrospinota bacterium]
MNARNIILVGDAEPIVIDFGRFGYWPWFYDLSRLELQLWLRLLGGTHMRDVFPAELPKWLELWRATKASSFPESTESVYNASSGTQNVASWISRRIADLRTRLIEDCANEYSGDLFANLVNLNRIYDCIKMSSYQVSWIKRLFFLIIAVDASSVLIKTDELSN